MMPEPPQQDAIPADGEQMLIHAARREAAELRGAESLTMPLMPDKNAFPGYDILRELRRGGQGAVYEAFQRSTSRKVAIKVMLGGPVASETARIRFEREVRLLASLRHPNIVVIHDSGLASGHPYFVMDFVPGEHLNHYCQARSLDVVGTIRLFRQVVDAVAFAHRKGIVHRDLKPSNIIVDENDIPLVLDFGLAKVVGRLQGEVATTLSKTGDMLGTLRYMSPEQLIGDPDSVDARTDVHALGIILFELLTGLHPYEVKLGASAVADRIRHVEPPRLSTLRSDVGPELERIVAKAMSNDPGRRYPSAVEMMQDLEVWLNTYGQAPTSGDQHRTSISSVVSGLRAYWPLVAGFAILLGGGWWAGHNMWGMNDRDQQVSAGQYGNSAGPPTSSAAADEPRTPFETQTAILDYVKKNLPLRSLQISQVPGERRVRVEGWVLNEAELKTLEDRIQRVREQVQLEVSANPEEMRLLVQRSLTDKGGRSIRVRLEGKKGSECLTVESSQAESETALAMLAYSYVFDRSSVRFRNY